MTSNRVSAQLVLNESRLPLKYWKAKTPSVSSESCTAVVNSTSQTSSTNPRRLEPTLLAEPQPPPRGLRSVTRLAFEWAAIEIENKSFGDVGCSPSILNGSYFQFPTQSLAALTQVAVLAHAVHIASRFRPCGYHCMTMRALVRSWRTWGIRTR